MEPGTKTVEKPSIVWVCVGGGPIQNPAARSLAWAQSFVRGWVKLGKNPWKHALNCGQPAVHKCTVAAQSMNSLILLWLSLAWIKKGGGPVEEMGPSPWLQLSSNFGWN